MIIIEARKPTSYVGEEVIDLEVLFEGYEKFLPFTAVPSDKYDHSKELFDRAISGEFGEVEYKQRPPETRPVQENILETLLARIEELEGKINELSK